MKFDPRTDPDVPKGMSVELLQDLHLLTRDGHLNADARRKLKQIRHLVGLLRPAIDDALARHTDPVVVDCGAGKSYLGAMLYELVLGPAGRGSITAIEARPELSEQAAKRAARFGQDRFRVATGAIGSFATASSASSGSPSGSRAAGVSSQSAPASSTIESLAPGSASSTIESPAPGSASSTIESLAPGSASSTIESLAPGSASSTIESPAPGSASGTIESLAPRSASSTIESLAPGSASSTIESPAPSSASSNGGPGDVPNQNARRPNVVTALHACDTATDDALVLAIAQGADHVAVVPCCQAEVARQLEASKPSDPVDAALFAHPLHRREFGSHLTNVIRALALEAHGYRVTVTELVGWEHSAKNELILGKRVQRFNPQARATLRALLDRFRIEPAVIRELTSRGLDPRTDPRANAAHAQ